MTDDRKISEYGFSEMNFNLVNIISLAKNNSYAEAQFRIGKQIINIFKVREIGGKVTLL